MSTASPKRICIQSGKTNLLEHLSEIALGYWSFEPINQPFG